MLKKAKYYQVMHTNIIKDKDDLTVVYGFFLLIIRNSNINGATKTAESFDV